MTDEEIMEQWKYAKEHFGAKLVCGDFGSWLITIDPKKVAETPEFKEYQRLASIIVHGEK